MTGGDFFYLLLTRVRTGKVLKPRGQVSLVLFKKRKFEVDLAPAKYRYYHLLKFLIDFLQQMNNNILIVFGLSPSSSIEFVVWALLKPFRILRFMHYTAISLKEILLNSGQETLTLPV